MTIRTFFSTSALAKRYLDDALLVLCRVVLASDLGSAVVLEPFRVGRSRDQCED